MQNARTLVWKKRNGVRAVPEGDNKASRALLEKLGFKLLEDEGRRYTSVLYEKHLVDDIPLKTVKQVFEEEEKYR